MRRFFDTNVLVYLFDASAPKKKLRAQELLTDAVTAGLILLSTQVLQEFFVVVTQKLAEPLAHEQAAQAVRDLSVLPMVQVDSGLILGAIATMGRYKLSFWDSLIVQAAMHGGAAVLYTEDLSHGQVIEGLTVENPFRN